ncbi:MAG: GNAT family N-acetyltransferase [Nitrososphaerales archaeon]
MNFLAARICTLLEGGDTDVLLAGDQPDGLVVLRIRPTLWNSGSECYLAELYVTPPRRGHGLGRALVAAALRQARHRRADIIDIGVHEPDLPARRLYESFGFINRAGGPDGPLIFVYERHPCILEAEAGMIVPALPPRSRGDSESLSSVAEDTALWGTSLDRQEWIALGAVWARARVSRVASVVQ